MRTPEQIAAVINELAKGKFVVQQRGYDSESSSLCWFHLSNMQTVYFNVCDTDKTIHQGLKNAGGL
ncbi:hypothetical protein VOWphi5012_039 [Vibrio phage phi50-12]|uniref:Uncharacterized protein n=1 Tax=Vibrio phage phi50-12 TaxID=2654972 RepID=A0A5P8PRB9_9CAUD|nr:hypothetical protein KNU82_gp039 [Vibrio phage phi50-12]QFR59823.1 hypothetical protein VOWphi5012_039 [Vibrio phage phi50-12]